MPEATLSDPADAPDPAARGGPATRAGKARARRNALGHGMTATTLLAEVLGEERLARHKAALQAEWQPSSGTEEILVLEMARHAAALEFMERAEPAVLRCGADHAIPLLGDPEATDSILAAAVTSEGAERTTRYRRAHEKGFHTALLRLQEARARPPVAVTGTVLPPSSGFASEHDCEKYLADRLHEQPFRCFGCGGEDGYWLARRKRWQCAGCSRQRGILTGTIMARSRVPLRAWFALIRALVTNPDVGTPELAQVARLARLATVRQLAAKIRRALGANNATDLLAGLNRVVVPASGGPVPTPTTKRTRCGPV